MDPARRSRRSVRWRAYRKTFERKFPHRDFTGSFAAQFCTGDTGRVSASLFSRRHAPASMTAKIRIAGHPMAKAQNRRPGKFCERLRFCARRGVNRCDLSGLRPIRGTFLAPVENFPPTKSPGEGLPGRKRRVLRPLRRDARVDKGSRQTARPGPSRSLLGVNGRIPPTAERGPLLGAA